MMKKFVKTGVIFAAVLLAVGLLFTVARQVEHQATGVAAPAVGTSAAGDTSPGKELMKWGVLLYAVGEVAGAIGMGIAHMRQVSRQERAEVRRSVAEKSERAPLLLYSEYKKAGAEAA